MIAPDAEALAGLLTDTVADEAAAHFALGDLLLAHTAPDALSALGYRSASALMRDMGERTGMSARKLQYHHATARTFPPDTRDLPIAWDVFRVAAEKSDDPVRWAQYAADHALSGRKLAAAIQQAGGDVVEAERIVWLARNAVARVCRVSGHEVTLRFEPGADLAGWRAAWYEDTETQVSASVLERVHVNAQAAQEAA